MMSLCEVVKDRVVKNEDAKDVSMLQRINEVIASKVVPNEPSSPPKSPSVDASSPTSDDDDERHFHDSLRKAFDAAMRTPMSFQNPVKDDSIVEESPISLVPIHTDGFCVEEGEGTVFDSDVLKKLEFKPLYIRRKRSSANQDGRENKQLHVQYACLFNKEASPVRTILSTK